MKTAEDLVVRKSITVELPQRQAFDLFTERIGEWWPVATHSLNRDAVETVVLEGREGGRLYERTAEGEEGNWGTVLVFDPPNRFVLEWTVNPTDTPTELVLSFTANGTGTRVELVHSGWDDDERRVNYDAGWDVVLRRYAEAAAHG